MYLLPRHKFNCNNNFRKSMLSKINSNNKNNNYKSIENKIKRKAHAFKLQLIVK